MPKHSKEHQDILKIGRKRYDTVNTAVAHTIDTALENIKFAYNIESGQWGEDEITKRKNKNRPYLTSNKLRKFIAQVANRERDSRATNGVIPVDDKADIETAKVYDDIIRQITYQSKAQEVYTNAGEQAIAGGFGYCRILTEYADDGFDQEILIKWIENQFSVRLDPRGNYCFIREGMTHEEFKEAYPNATIIDFESGNIGEEYALWYEGDKVFVAEYFYKKPVDKEIAQVRKLVTEEGVVEEVEIVELAKKVTEETLKAHGYEVLKTRKVKTHEIRWVKMTGNEILEEGLWPGKFIPVFEVVGDEVSIAGKKYKRSLIADGKDPQRMYNYWLTKMTETIALAPNAPYMVTAEQIGPNKALWDSANVEELPYLVYTDNGRTVKPTRELPPQVPSGAAFMLNIADNDIQDTIGMFEASFGQQGNERSKVAIDARSRKSDLGTFHFQDNLRRMIDNVTIALIDLIPKIMDTERVVRIRGEEGQGEEAVVINKVVIDDETGEEIIINDLSVGKYDIRENIRSSSTRRQEAAEFMLQALQYAGDAAIVILPELFRKQDWEGAKEIADQLKRQFGGGGQPPSGEGGEPEDIPAEAMVGAEETV